jgi:hypothetical protein
MREVILYASKTWTSPQAREIDPGYAKPVDSALPPPTRKFEVSGQALSEGYEPALACCPRVLICYVKQYLPASSNIGGSFPLLFLPPRSGCSAKIL